MKLFQQLLVAPAALGLIAPVAQAADLNIQGVSDYASADQVTSISQFTDVYPTDWAYQALSNLIGRYGCVAGYPNGSFSGNRAMTRYEAAALLNACLDRVTEQTDDVRRLVEEFEQELAVIGGRIDGLEARVGELEATQFSTTTKLKGKADLFLGAISYDDRDKCNKDDDSACDDDAFNFTYRLTLNLNTSFTGKDRLYTRIRTGNMSNVWTDGNSYLADAKSGDNTLKVDKLWYSWPMGQFKFTVGPLIENYYMVKTPTRYKSILKAFKLGGYGAVMGASTGQGAGISWDQKVGRGEPGFNVAASYVADGGEGAKSESKYGLFGRDTDGLFLSQVGFGNKKWMLSALYAHKHGEDGSKPAVGYSTPLAKNYDAALNAFGIRAFWTPERAGILPQISGGVDFGNSDPDEEGAAESTFGWMVGLNWKNAFAKGNKLGGAFGTYSSYATSVEGDDDPEDENFAAEIWYSFKVSDNINIKPAVFWVTDADGAGSTKGSDVFGAVVQTSLKF